jgi:hypothetical protein
MYEALCKRRPKKVALVACSRKLLTVVWHMLRKQQPFHHEPYLSDRSQEDAPVRRARKAVTATTSV